MGPGFESQEHAEGEETMHGDKSSSSIFREEIRHHVEYVEVLDASRNDFNGLCYMHKIRYFCSTRTWTTASSRQATVISLVCSK